MTYRVYHTANGGAKRTSRKAFVYIMHEDRSLGIPSTGYINTCLEGYFSFNFDPEYLMQAIDYSWEVCAHENK